jgi:hypothetical protein
MFYLKPTKLKVISSSIPLILIFTVHAISSIGYYVFGPKAEVSMSVVHTFLYIKRLPFYGTFLSLINSMNSPDFYLNGERHTSIWVGNLNGIFIGMLYFIAIYIIYSIAQYFFNKMNK